MSFQPPKPPIQTWWVVVLFLIVLAMVFISFYSSYHGCA